MKMKREKKLLILLNIFQHQRETNCLFHQQQPDSLSYDILLLEYLQYGIRFFEKITPTENKFLKIIKLPDTLGQSHLLDIKLASLSYANLFQKMLKLKLIPYLSHLQVCTIQRVPRHVTRARHQASIKMT